MDKTQSTIYKSQLKSQATVQLDILCEAMVVFKKLWTQFSWTDSSLLGRVGTVFFFFPDNTVLGGRDLSPNYNGRQNAFRWDASATCKNYALQQWRHPVNMFHNSFQLDK